MGVTASNASTPRPLSSLHLRRSHATHRNIHTYSHRMLPNDQHPSRVRGCLCSRKAQDCPSHCLHGSLSRPSPFSWQVPRLPLKGGSRSWRCWSCQKWCLGAKIELLDDMMTGRLEGSRPYWDSHSYASSREVLIDSLRMQALVQWPWLGVLNNLSTQSHQLYLFIESKPGRRRLCSNHLHDNDLKAESDIPKPKSGRLQYKIQINEHYVIGYLDPLLYTVVPRRGRSSEMRKTVEYPNRQRE